MAVAVHQFNRAASLALLQASDHTTITLDGLDARINDAVGDIGYDVHQHH